MRKIIISFLFGLLLLGCNPKVEPPVSTPISTERIVTDGLGQKYRLIQPSKQLENGVVVIELWEKIGVTNRWYTPTLEWQMHPDSIPTFNSISK